MPPTRAETEIAPRLARAIVVAVSAALVSIHFLKGLGHVATDPWTGLATAVVTAAVFVLQLRYAFPRARRFQTGWILAAQLALSYLAVVPLGVSVGLLCLPVAALLLDRRWALACAAVVSASLIDGGRGDSVRNATDMTLTVALGGVVLYGITTLAFLVTEVHTARLTLAMSAVAAERLRIAGELEQGLSDGLDTIGGLAAREDLSGLDDVVTVARESLASARATAADFRSLSLAPEAASARGLLTAAGIETELRVGHSEPLGPAGALLAMVLREAATAVVRRGDARRCLIETSERDGPDGRVELRVLDDGVPTAALGADALEDLGRRVREAGGRFSASLDPDGLFVVTASVAATPKPASPSQGPELRMMAALYYFLLGAFCVKSLLYVPLGLFPLAIPCIVALCGLQIHFAVRDVKRGARLGLVVLALIAFVPLYWFGRDWIGVPGFLVGSLLVAFRFAVAVPLVAATMAVGGLINGAARGSFGQAVDGAVSTLVTGLIVYGLLRLARLARELHAAGDALERAAIVQERLRAARDLHDLLGHSLAAVVLKAELARRLADTDPGRTRGELRDIAAMADRAQADLRTVTGAPADLTFATELASAASVLAAADVATEVDPVGEQLPAALESVLSAILREAVTNILRHSTAGHARIAVTVTPESVRLDVENDGASGTVTPPGSGLGNLAIRLAELGGTLAAGPDDGWFLLRAEVPAVPVGSRPSTTSPAPAPATASPPRARSAPRPSGSGR